jgi:hypothetical protein
MTADGATVTAAADHVEGLTLPAQARPARYFIIGCS